MTTATFVVGDTRHVITHIPDGSIDLVLTSPPFLGLRSYLPADHPDKHLEVGSENTPAAFLDALLAATADWARVLAPHGTIAVELGDTYAGSGGAGGDYASEGLRAGQAKFDGSAVKARRHGIGDTRGPSSERLRTRRTVPGWPDDKCLAMIPELYRVALAYGINPLTGEPSPAGRWRVRNVVRWVRPNPPVGALGDKYRPGTSDLVVACRDRKRWFDLDAVRTPLTEPGVVKTHSVEQHNPSAGWDSNQAEIRQNPGGAPPLDWWNAVELTIDNAQRSGATTAKQLTAALDTAGLLVAEDAWKISPGGYRGAHFAVFPPELADRPIRSMCPTEVCRTCGEPRRRITKTNPDYEGRAGGPTHNNAEQGASLQGFPHKAYPTPKFLPSDEFSDCGHGKYRPGRVLDPFAGTGTTGLVATGYGRDAVLIDIDERNLDLARRRIGMFLHHAQADELTDLLGEGATETAA